MSEAVGLPLVAAHVAIAIAECIDITPEALHAHLAGQSLRVPYNRVAQPRTRRDGLPPSLVPGLVFRLVGPGRLILVLENAGVVAHHAQRDLEGGGRAVAAL